MPQTRPRLDDDLAADVRAYAEEWRISFNDAVKILLVQGLQVAAWPQRPREKRAGQEQDAGSTP